MANDSGGSGWFNGTYREAGYQSVLPNRNRNIQTSTAPTKAKSREPAYSLALSQNKIDSQRIKSGESGRQIDGRPRWVMFRVEMTRDVRRRGRIRIGFMKEQCFQF